MRAESVRKLSLEEFKEKQLVVELGIASAVDCRCYPFGKKLSELALGIGPFVVGPAVREK